MNELREQVSQVLTDLSAFDSSDLVDNSCELEAVVKRAKNRNNIDVTDKLWEILKSKYLKKYDLINGGGKGAP